MTEKYTHSVAFYDIQPPSREDICNVIGDEYFIATTHQKPEGEQISTIITSQENAQKIKEHLKPIAIKDLRASSTISHLPPDIKRVQYTHVR